ncbi:MAG TPA: hypothetical protein VGR16_09595, partial [Thermomicrobiales bacterium]|nr:hypothetical protein [Thermomicrobiales bacterium]
MRVPRLVTIFSIVAAGMMVSVATGAAQGTGGGAVITVTVVDSYGATVPGATVSAVDGDSPPTSQGPESTGPAGQVQLTNFVVDDAVTITAQPPPGVGVAGSTTTITVLATPSSVTLTLGAPPSIPTPT